MSPDTSDCGKVWGYLSSHSLKEKPLTSSLLHDTDPSWNLGTDLWLCVCPFKYTPLFVATATSMAALSSKWRAKPDVCLEPAATPKGKPSESPSWNPCDGAVKLSMSEIRGEDDPRTLQAIEEGRRLYVGDLPYLAEPKTLTTSSWTMATKCKPQRSRFHLDCMLGAFST